VNAHLKAYNFTDEQRKEYGRNNQYEEWFKQDIKSGIYSVMGYFVGCSSDVYKDILKGSSQVLQNRSNIPGVIIAEKIRNKKTVSLIPGDIIKITWSKRGYPSWEKYEREFMVEAVIENTPFKFNVDQGSLGIIGENGVIGDSFGLAKYQVLEIDTNNRANENEVEGRLKEIANNQKNGKLISYSSDLARYKKTVFQTAAVLYTLFAVAAIIVIVNIINTISMNILTRGREFGMLRALGMTKNQLRGMIIKEGIIYGAAGSIGGTLLGIGFCALIYKGLILQINYYDKFKVNYTSIILTFIISMLLTACATIIPLKRATKLDVIESIRAIE
jgi:putative ABC transport system permease protein